MDIFDELGHLKGYFLRREAIEVGVDDNTLCRCVREGRLVRIRQGAYATMARWRHLSEEARFLCRSLAAYDLARGEVALSHFSAVAFRGGPLWRAPLAQVHLTRCDAGSSRAEAGTVHHVGALDDSDLEEVDGVWVTSPARTLLDCLGLLSQCGGVVLGDWMLRHDLVDLETLWDLKNGTNHWPRSRRAEVVLRFIDAGADTVIESVGRYLFWRIGVPKPILQCVIMDGNRHVATTDWGWPWLGIYGEADGLVKYGRALHPGQDIAEVLVAEKVREDDVRRVTGGHMVRWISSELNPTSAPTRQLLELIRRAA